MGKDDSPVAFLDASAGRPSTTASTQLVERN
jgi:hypothetical protein